MGLSAVRTSLALRACGVYIRSVWWLRPSTKHPWNSVVGVKTTGRGEAQKGFKEGPDKAVVWSGRREQGQQGSLSRLPSSSLDSIQYHQDTACAVPRSLL